MLCFDQLAKSLGMVLMSQAQPNLHREIIIAQELKMTECSGIRSFDFMRGWYSTWIKGPETEGCGMHRPQVLAVDPTAAQSWLTRPAFITYHKLESEDHIKPGVIPLSLIRGSWWAYTNSVITTADGKTMPLDVYCNMRRDQCPTRIMHKGVVYPLKKKELAAAT